MKVVYLIIFISTLFLDLYGQGITFYVSPSGNDNNIGSLDKPVATIEKARQLIRNIKTHDILKDSITVFLREGVYRIKDRIDFYPIDGGTKEFPVIYRNYKKENVTISGAINIKYSSANTLLSNKYFNNKIIEIDLKKAGLSKLEILRLSLTGRNISRKSFIFRELYFNKKPMPLSRWPNNGYTKIIDIKERSTAYGNQVGIVYKDSRVSNWKEHSNILLHGYWKYLWDDAFEYISELDTANKTIWLRPEYNNYGFANNRPYAAFNIFEEIDRKGEWAYNYNKGKLYFYPPSDNNQEIEFSICESPLLNFKNTQYITIKGINLEMSALEGIRISYSDNILIKDCKVHDCASDGINIVEGNNNKIYSCEIFNTGRGAIRVSGGDRTTLKKSGFIIDNCHIHNISRIDKTYTPGVWVEGVGTTISHCEFHDIPSSAMCINGNNHTIEYNKIHHVVTESDDQGAIDMYGNPTYRGNIFRYNYFYDIGPRKKDAVNAYCGRAGIRLDDAISGNIIYGNIFMNCSNGNMGAVQIHGGKENKIYNNLFYKCKIGLSFNTWSHEYWLKRTKKYLGFLEKNKNIYISHYPELSDLNKNLNINTIQKNIFLRCKRITGNNTDKQVLQSNLLLKANENNNYLESNNYSLVNISDILKNNNIKLIPFKEIGLRK